MLIKLHNEKKQYDHITVNTSLQFITGKTQQYR